MRIVEALLLLALAASASAGETPENATGDIQTYDPFAPPGVAVKEVYANEIDTEVFILVEGALLVPDTIRLREDQRVYNIEVVDAEELGRFEPVAQLRFPETLALNGDPIPGEKLVRYEQRMWRKGLRVACRDYESSRGVKTRYTAFRVTFEPCGDLYRAVLTLYQAKQPISQQLDAVLKRLDAIQAELTKLQKEVKQAGTNVSAAVDHLKEAVAALRNHVNDLDRKLASLDNQVGSLESRIGSLEQTR